MLLLWDVGGGLTQIDTYLLSVDDNVKAGALLAIGIVNSAVRDENEPALALLQDYVLSPTQAFRVGSCMGLGLAYAASANAVVGELLLPVLEDPASTMEVLGVTALALGQVFVGTCDGPVTEALVQVLMLKSAADLATPHARLIALALGLVHLGKQQAADVVLATLASVEGSFGKLATVLVEACAYAGTGNVVFVQRMLHHCSEHVDTAAETYAAGDDAFQTFAVLGLALIAMGEEIGTEMALRSCNHLLQYGEPVIRRAVPLALALLCVSNPRLHVLDVLGKLSHDPDAATAHAAILAMGFVGAGTNHARIAGMLRALAQYYHSNANAVFIVRLAQGLLHTGKGSITLSPFHTDRTLWSPVAVAGLLGALVAAADLETMILQANHFMLYHLALAMYPRILSTLDEDLNAVSTLVRVGNAVDTVAQAGNPKTITGFITNNTPVLLGFGERAQLATDEYLPQTPVVEGFVLVKKNPEYEH